MLCVSAAIKLQRFALTCYAPTQTWWYWRMYKCCVILTCWMVTFYYSNEHDRHSHFVWKPPHQCNWNLFPVLTFHISTAILWRRSFRKTRTRHRRSDSRRCVHFVGSRGPAKPAFCQSRREKFVIHEQFTVKTHQVSAGLKRGQQLGHTYSSLQLKLTFKRLTKQAKMHEMYKLFIFVAVFSAAAKLRRLALCVYL